MTAYSSPKHYPNLSPSGLTRGFRSDTDPRVKSEDDTEVRTYSSPKTPDFLDNLKATMDQVQPYRIFGKVLDVQGLVVVASADLPHISIGAGVIIQKGSSTLRVEVIALHGARATILLADSVQGLSVGDTVEYKLLPLRLAPTMSWCGRVLDAFGAPCDDKGPLMLGTRFLSLRNPAIPAQKRFKLKEPLDLGVRSLNAFTTACKGQRLGIFSGSGVGKSVLLSMLARYTQCDVAVIGMIGERGRELKEFIEDTLGLQGMQKSIIVVATSNEPPLARRQAAYTTLTIAEGLRDQGKDVLCIVDSITRFAMAQREIGLSAGEPPTTKGYPPSTFSELAMLCERAGPGYEECEPEIIPGGSITGFFSVLVDGDDHNEPIADAVRGILDGHIVLDRQIAQRGHYPAVNVLKSLSRLASKAQTDAQKDLVQEARQILSTYDDMSDLIRLGAYQSGANFEVDRAIMLHHAFEEFLTQKPEEHSTIDETFDMLEKILRP